ncbi:hypothetical protein OG426_55700 (plasmid) [Streptomyces canus]|uniref:hypothetical protein n=1 Tax=Streptomyces canus TaxID=58343 RepID=UPI002F908A83|nr:hypothetical protein OG426_55700 [Streptomyces canus]
MQTPDSFRAAHGDVTTWSTAEIESYEHTVEAASPAFAEAVATNRFVLGRHFEGGRVVVDLATAEDLAQRREAGALHHFVGGTRGSGKTSQAALLQAQLERLVS